MVSFIRKDLILHFGACALAAGFTAVILALLSSGIFTCAITGSFLAGTFCGLGKEYGDKCAPGNYWDWTDVWADLIGALAGSQLGWLALLFG